MTALGVAATWIAISVVGAKGLMVFARAVASSELEIDLYAITAESGTGYGEANRDEASIGSEASIGCEASRTHFEALSG
jgi:hypothetical protein